MSAKETSAPEAVVEKTVSPGASAASRLAALRAVLAKSPAPALILTDSLNIGYITAAMGLTDFEDPHVALVTPKRALLFTDSRYSETARQQVAQTGALWQVVEFSVGSPAGAQVVDRLAEQSCTAVMLEDTMSHRRYGEWMKRLADHDIETCAAVDLVEGLRRCKDAAELEAIAAAQAITDAAFAQMLGWMEVGMTEAAVALELEYRLRCLGATGLAFPSIIASGPNGAKPHALPSQRVIERGDLLVMDFGASLNGYCSDMTRTVAFGDPGEEARAVYAVVRAAQQAGLDAARAGSAGSEVDAQARAIISQAGYGAYFGHGLSHGLGLLVHEAPHGSPRSSDTFAVGDVISVEPGVYLPGRFGIRIEDLIALTFEGIRNFTSSPKDLITL
ncbi:MAG: aminopeptidase P family protein [Actinomycetia bacterium]|nr:aminopeptidase P family protein [Actinomycetes bacterium]